MYDNPSSNETVRCSFCGKTQEEVKTQLEQSKQQVINETSQKAKEVINKTLPNFLDNLQKNIKQQQQQQQTSTQQQQ